MGEQLVGDLVMVTSDGREMRFENASIMKAELLGTGIDVGDSDFSVSNGSAELEVSVGNISKKRFVKLLMGKGMQRNEATEMAKYVIRKYGYYNPMQLIMF